MNKKKKNRPRPAIISYEQISRGKSILLAVMSFVILLAAWQLAVIIFPDFGKIFPGPGEVGVALVQSLYIPIGKLTLIPNLLVTLSRMFVGYIAGAAIGIVTGLAMGTSRTVRAIISPLFEVMRPIPAIAWIPMAILWFGIGEESKYFIVGISTFVICTLNAIAGAERTSPVLKGAARMLGATDKQLFTKVILPSSIPQIFAGLQIALSAGSSTILAAEMIRSNEGAGWLIIRGMDTGNMTQILIGIIAISLAGLGLATLMRAIERKAISWNIRGR